MSPWNDAKNDAETGVPHAPKRGGSGDFWDPGWDPAPPPDQLATGELACYIIIYFKISWSQLAEARMSFFSRMGSAIEHKQQNGVS